MAAFGAATSLKNTIQRILQSSRISLVPPSPQIIQLAYKAMVRLQKVLLRLDDTGYNKIRTEVNALDELIKVVIWEFEDLLESLFTDQILPQLGSPSKGERDHSSFYVDLQSLRQSVDCFVERVALMEADFDVELVNMPDEEGESPDSRIDCQGINSEMVGLSDEFERVRDHLLKEVESDESDESGEFDFDKLDSVYMNGSLITGMAGVGKTTLAKKVFDDPSIQEHFDFQAWVKVGRKYEPNEILLCILAQVDLETLLQMITQEEDIDDEEFFYVWEEILKDKKCLIVLDDVWEWDRQVMNCFPGGSVRFLLTSRLGIKSYMTQKVRLLNEEESKKLLGEKVFGEEGFPPHLEKLGEKIAKKCEGLPLMIVTVAELLSKEDKARQCWTEIADKQHNYIFEEAYNQIYEVLFPSYNYLPQYLKMLFLYLGAFAPYCDIKVHNLFQRLSAEGFLEPSGKQSLKDYMVQCSKKLFYWYHLILADFDFDFASWFSKHEFRVHSCWQNLCKKEASKIKFLHVLQNWDDDVTDQRRLCVHSNSLFSFEQVYDSIKRDCASTSRSLLCFGPYHSFPVPIHTMDFKLLRVLDALDVRFYHIPLEIMKLVCLNYLSLTYNGELPVSISNLFLLQSLIIHPTMYIKKRQGQSYLPVQIWDMQELQHIEVLGRDMPTPIFDSTLEKLFHLEGVSPKSCTREILKRIPNLKELGIQIELKPYDDENDSYPLIGLDYSSDEELEDIELLLYRMLNPEMVPSSRTMLHVSDMEYISEELQYLEQLSYFVLNPDMKYKSILPLSMFPSSLTGLHLSGLGCPWKLMNDIGSLLPKLTTLKLEEYAFQGREWEIELDCFPKLTTLVIEDTDLVRWVPQYGSLPRLNLLSIRHCYKLQQLDWSPTMDKRCTIELVECNPLAVTSANQLRPKSLFTVRSHSTF